jgi:hypothetical protein
MMLASRGPADCALNGTVVASVLLPGHPTILPLVHSAAAAGFPCVVVQPLEPMVPADETMARLLLPLPLPNTPLLPRGSWCNSSEYWSRRAQFYRLRLWRTLLDLRLDLLGVDSRYQLLRNPLPAIAALRTRNDAQYGGGVRPDVIGHTPGWFLKQFGLGLIVSALSPNLATCSPSEPL